MEIKGIVTNIIYRNEENGYTIIKLKTSDDSITCVGTMPIFNEGDNVNIIGTFVYHDKYGEQINVDSISLVKPNDKTGIINFLANSNIKGIGKKTAIVIYNEFGKDSIDIIYKNPENLLKIKGIGKKKLEEIKISSNDLKESRDTILFLQNLNISYNLSMKIYKLYKENTIDIIKSNPYKLVEDISGIGFAIADKIAFNMQIASNSKFRISAGINYILSYEADFNGHCSIEYDLLVKKVSKLLNITSEDIKKEIDDDAIERKIDIVIIEDKKYVYKNSLFKAEKFIATALFLKKNSPYIFDVDIDFDFSIFSKEQENAITEAFKNMLLVITGGPGTGKTTVIKAITKILTDNKLTYALLAPTGRAAKRIQESSNEQAYTIHRLLGIKPEEKVALYNQDNPIDKDYIIVDEMSMVDIYLMRQLLSAISENTALIMVGDSDQLPSVGPGNVLKDIINTNIKTVRLEKIYRQSLKSNIIVNAHKINKGQYPILNESDKDFFFIEANQNNFDFVLGDLVANRLAKFYNFDSIKDIQILCPSKKTNWGSQNINKNLQKLLNKSEKSLEINDKIFKIDDKVMQIRNNYDLIPENSSVDAEGVYNGDIGFIDSIDYQEEMIKVIFYDGSLVSYNKEDIKDLELSYAITIHKSQGSEFDCVIIPMMQVAPMLLNRNLLYTGITRAKKLLVLVGEKRILKQMIDNNYSNKRFTNLSYWIKEMENMNFDWFFIFG